MSSPILKLLENASKAYYDGEPILSNEEYDALERMYGQIIGGHGEVEHMFPMYSLQKHYVDDGEPPLNVQECIETPKFDGAAVSLLYVDGHLAKALTRGNGKKGRDITEKLSHLVPQHIVSKKPTQITGEVVALKTVENSRNYASGALNLKDIEEFKERVKEGEMIFIAYGTSDMSSQYFHDMDNLYREGFYTCLSYELSKLYPTDGKVFRVNKNDKFLELGYTAKFPRGAFAWKENQEAVVTRLIDVVWNTGKSGKVTPTAILEPVVIGEATVGRATLNNIAYIEALDLEIGCMVEVIRSGEIIPKIIGRAD